MSYFPLTTAPPPPRCFPPSQISKTYQQNSRQTLLSCVRSTKAYRVYTWAHMPTSREREGGRRGGGGGGGGEEREGEREGGREEGEVERV